MTKEQQEKYDKIAATGRFNEEQLAKLRAGFEKEPRKFDIEKSKLHTEKAASCQRLEKIDPSIRVDWSPEDDSGDAYIFISAPNGYNFAGSTKTILLDAISFADTVSYTYFNDSDMPDTVVITLGFMGIIEDPNKPDNFTAN